MPLHLVPNPAHWVRVINVLMTRVVLPIPCAMKTELMRFPPHHLPQFLQLLRSHIIVERILMMLPPLVIIPAQVVYLKNALGIFYVLQAHPAKLGDLSSVEKVGKTRPPHAPYHVKMV